MRNRAKYPAFFVVSVGSLFGQEPRPTALRSRKVRMRVSLLSALLVGATGVTLPLCAVASADVLNGRWEWEATCDRGAFHGIMEFTQTGSAFSGQFLETNFWDKGTISNGIIRDNHISFDRTYGLIVQHLAADLLPSNRALSGPYNSKMFGKCVLRGKKL